MLVAINGLTIIDGPDSQPDEYLAALRSLYLEAERKGDWIMALFYSGALWGIRERDE